MKRKLPIFLAVASLVFASLACERGTQTPPPTTPSVTPYPTSTPYPTGTPIVIPTQPVQVIVVTVEVTRIVKVLVPVTITPTPTSTPTPGG